jgi:hypothetical protein
MSSISIDLTGIVRSLYDDDVAGVLQEMGVLDVQRASNVEFDNLAQGWLIFMVKNEALGIDEFAVGPFQKREDALQWETQYLDARLCGLSDSEACKIASKKESQQCHRL